MGQVCPLQERHGFEQAFPADRQPYPIQRGFMHSLYTTLQLGGILLAESPTGTGKTISIICSALKWLEDERSRAASAAAAAAAAAQAAHFDDDDPDWLKHATPAGNICASAAPATQQPSSIPTEQHMVTENGCTRQQQAQGESSRRELARARQRQRSRAPGAVGLLNSTKGPPIKHARLPTAQLSLDEDCLDQFVLEEGGHQGQERVGCTRRRTSGLLDAGSSSDDSDSEEQVTGRMPEETDTRPQKVQIIFCSRTHSQLSQFVAELRRTGFAERLSVVALASRGVLCINEEVRRLEAPSLINERCLDLQQERAAAKSSKALRAASDHAQQPQQGGKPQQRSIRVQHKAAAGGCPHLAAAGGPEAEAWADEAVLQPMDVEDLARHGRQKGVCPYYGARSLLRDADIVLAPYSSVLLPEARQAMGLWLEGAVLIVDEAHNLVDAVNAGHSHHVTLSQLRSSLALLQHYWGRFSSRLAARNAQNLQLLIKVVGQLVTAVSPRPAAALRTALEPDHAQHAAPPRVPPSGSERVAPESVAASKEVAPPKSGAAPTSVAAPMSVAAPKSVTPLEAGGNVASADRAASDCAAPRSVARSAQASSQAQEPRGSPPWNGASTASRASPSFAAGVNDFLFDHELDHVNLFSLMAWVRDSRILRKLSGYTKWQQQQQQQQQHGIGGVNVSYEHQPAACASKTDAQLVAGGASGRAGAVLEAGGVDVIGRGRGRGDRRPELKAQKIEGLSEVSRGDRVGALHATMAFISSLTNADADGRVIVTQQQQQQQQQQPCAAGQRDHSNRTQQPQQQQQQQQQKGAPAGKVEGETGSLKFVLLNASAHFAQVLTRCRSVVLASGTLAPVEGLVAQLFPHLVRGVPHVDGKAAQPPLHAAPVRQQPWHRQQLEQQQQQQQRQPLSGLQAAAASVPSQHSLHPVASPSNTSLSATSCTNNGTNNTLPVPSSSFFAPSPSSNTSDPSSTLTAPQPHLQPTDNREESSEADKVAQQVLASCPARLLGVLVPRAGEHPTQPVLHFECGHVVPKEQVAVLVAGKGPSGRPLELRHNTRSLPEVMDEVGRLLTNVCSGVPDGVVVFMPSFAYLEQLMQRWAATGALKAMAARKQVFREPRAAAEVEAVLQQYAQAITQENGSNSSGGDSAEQASRSSSSSGSGSGGGGGSRGGWGGSDSSSKVLGRKQTGALLLAVVGGKLSEGINFGDRLGRCVVVVGMPYANPTDPELAQRMAYWDARSALHPSRQFACSVLYGTSSSSSVGVSAASRSMCALSGSHLEGIVQGGSGAVAAEMGWSGQQLYEAMCMNAVNQCVGRVVRHASDYAAIVLADARYLGGRSEGQALGEGSNMGAAQGTGYASSVRNGNTGAPVSKLPSWLQQSLRTQKVHEFGHVYSQLVSFFRQHR